MCVCVCVCARVGAPVACLIYFLCVVHFIDLPSLNQSFERACVARAIELWVYVDCPFYIAFSPFKKNFGSA